MIPSASCSRGVLLVALAAVFIASSTGCHLLLDPDRHVGEDLDGAVPDAAADTRPPEDAAPDTVVDAGPDTGGLPCTNPGGPDPVCGPALITRCGDTMRCESCFGNSWRHTLVYGPEGSQEPTRPTMAISGTHGADGAAWGHLAWVTNYPAGTESVVVTSIPLASTDPNDQLNENLGLLSGPTASDDFTTESVAFGTRSVGGVPVEAHLFGYGETMGAPALFASVVTAAGVSSPRAITTMGTPRPGVGVTGSGVDDSASPLRHLWRGLAEDLSIRMYSAEAWPGGAGASESVATALPDGSGTSVRGTASNLALIQPVGGGLISLWDAAGSAPPTEVGRSTGDASLAYEASGTYVLALPEGASVELARYQCRDGACSGTNVGLVSFDGAVTSTALAAFPDGGLALVATFQSAGEAVLEVRAVGAELEALAGWGADSSLYRSPSPDTIYNELHAGVIDSGGTRQILVGAHESSLGVGLEQVSLTSITFTSRCDP